MRCCPSAVVHVAEPESMRGQPERAAVKVPLCLAMPCRALLTCRAAPRCAWADVPCRAAPRCADVPCRAMLC
eukprot:8490462-Alexandrium_andersonii.AAC.1